MPSAVRKFHNALKVPLRQGSSQIIVRMVRNRAFHGFLTITAPNVVASAQLSLCVTPGEVQSKKYLHNILQEIKNEARFREKFWQYFAVEAYPACEICRTGAPYMRLDILEISIDLKYLLFFRNLAQSKNPSSYFGVSRWENMFISEWYIYIALDK